MMKTAAFLFLFAAAGCSDPHGSPLRPGDDVVAYSGTSDEILSLKVDGKSAMERIPVGAHLDVSEDSTGGGTRIVVVILRAGENAGKTAEVRRFDLRPAR